MLCIMQELQNSHQQIKGLTRTRQFTEQVLNNINKNQSNLHKLLHRVKPQLFFQMPHSSGDLLSAQKFNNDHDISGISLKMSRNNHHGFQVQLDIDNAIKFPTFKEDNNMDISQFRGNIKNDYRFSYRYSKFNQQDNGDNGLNSKYIPDISGRDQIKHKNVMKLQKVQDDRQQQISDEKIWNMSRNVSLMDRPNSKVSSNLKKTQTKLSIPKKRKVTQLKPIMNLTTNSRKSNFPKLSERNKMKNQQKQQFKNLSTSKKNKNSLLADKSYRNLKEKKIQVQRSQINSFSKIQSSSLDEIPKLNSKYKFRSTKSSSKDPGEISIQELYLFIYNWEKDNQNGGLPQTTWTAKKIYNFFQNVLQSQRLNMFKDPFIKKYRNCIYFGSKYQKNNPNNINSFQSELGQQQEAQSTGFIWYFRKCLYYGDFYNGRKNGYGIEIDFQNNTIWKGQFENGNKNGYFQVSCQQYIYNGNIKNGQFHGQGVLKNKIDKSIYNGNFRTSKKQGRGQQRFYNKKKQLVTYRGQFSDNMFHGQGQLIVKGVQQYYYKGDFKENQIHGKGYEKMKYEEYCGYFRYGFRQGKGILQIKNSGSKEIFDGLFFKGRFIRKLTKQQIQTGKIGEEFYNSKKGSQNYFSGSTELKYHKAIPLNQPKYNNVITPKIETKYGNLHLQALTEVNEEASAAATIQIDQKNCQYQRQDLPETNYQMKIREKVQPYEKQLKFSNDQQEQYNLRWTEKQQLPMQNQYILQ